MLACAIAVHLTAGITTASFASAANQRSPRSLRSIRRPNLMTAPGSSSMTRPCVRRSSMWPLGQVRVATKRAIDTSRLVRRTVTMNRRRLGTRIHNGHRRRKMVGRVKRMQRWAFRISSQTWMSQMKTVETNMKRRVISLRKSQS